MKTNSILSVILFFASFADAQTSFESIGLPMMKKAVHESFQSDKSKESCPAAGKKDFDGLVSTRGGAMSSDKITETLLNEMNSKHVALLSDSTQCGSCQQVNEVAQFTTSQPEKVKLNASCNNRPTINIQKELRNSDVQKYASDTLRGKTEEGKKVYEGCPDPCSFYVASATTATSADTSLLNLTVHCGQPRDGNILFAKYLFSGGLIQSWTCQ